MVFAALKPVSAIVYQAKNLVNGHRYIGFTIQGLQARATEHRKHANSAHGGYHFQRAIKKYGPENFVFGIMAEFGEDEELGKLYEREAIEGYKPEYNLKHGGVGGSMPAITRQRISASNKGRVGPMKGKKFTDEHRAKISAANKGRPKLALRGVPFSDERRRKISAAAMGRPGNGRRAIVCVTEGKIFESVVAAARHYSTSTGYIGLVAKGRKKSIKGLVFQYVEDQPK